MRAASAARIGIVAGLAALVPVSAFGQPPAASQASRHLFEYWFGPTLVFSGPDATISADYAVDFLNGTGSGRATQQLTLDTPRHLGVEGGIGVFPSRRFGLQARLNYVSEDFAGTSGPYHVTLDYTSAQPPDYIPAQYHLDASTDWQAPTGVSTLLTVSFEGAARWESGARLSGSVSGGLAYFRAKGHLDSLAFTQYVLGGHSVLFSNTYAMSVSYGTVTALGFDAGGGVAVNLAGPLDLLADVRYFHAGRQTPEFRVSGFADPTANPGNLSVQVVAAHMAPLTGSFDPSFARIFFGVRIRS